MSRRIRAALALACSVLSLLVYLLLHRAAIGSILEWLGAG